MKKPSLNKIDPISIIGFPSSTTIPHKNDNEKIDKPSPSYNNPIFEEKGTTTFSLSKTKNVKLAPLKTNLPSTINNENQQAHSANYSIHPAGVSKQSYLRKSIIAAHKMAEEQMKNEEIKKDELNIEEMKGELIKPVQKESKKENIPEEKNNLDENEDILNPRKRLSQKKDNFVGVS